MLLLLCEKIIIFSLQSSLCLFSNGHKRPKGDWLFLMVKAMGNQTLSTEMLQSRKKRLPHAKSRKEQSHSFYHLPTWPLVKPALP